MPKLTDFVTFRQTLSLTNIGCVRVGVTAQIRWSPRAFRSRGGAHAPHVRPPRRRSLVPASSGELARLKNGYERDVQEIDAPGDAASKKLKARTFDAVRAPVAGW
jgi:hypothetical protein